MKKYLFITLFVLLLFCLFFAWHVIRFSDRNLHIVFCDVGQGDAILITTPTGKQILMDGGPDDAVLGCLSDHMPFWDREIELMMVSHPQMDHFGGLLDVVRQYKVGMFVEPGAPGTAAAWEELGKALSVQKMQRKAAQKGITIRLGNVSFFVLNPYDPVLQSKEDINNESIVGVLSYADFDVLLTGDILPEAIETFEENIADIEVLKVPHHGSKNGLTKTMMDRSSPELAVISSGKGNKFGHPHKEALDLLEGVRTFRTDQKGDIEIVSDGKKWWIKR